MKIPTATAALVAACANAVQVEWTWPELLNGPSDDVIESAQALFEATTKMTQADEALKSAPIDASSLLGLHELKCEYRFQREMEMWAACAHVSLLDYIDGHFGVNTETSAYERWYAAYNSCSVEVDGYTKSFWVDSGACTGFYNRGIGMPAITWPEEFDWQSLWNNVQPPIVPPTPPPAPPAPIDRSAYYPQAGLYTKENGNAFWTTESDFKSDNYAFYFDSFSNAGGVMHYQSCTWERLEPVHKQVLMAEKPQDPHSMIMSADIFGDMHNKQVHLLTGTVNGVTAPAFQIGSGPKYVMTGHLPATFDLGTPGACMGAKPSSTFMPAPPPPPKPAPPARGPDDGKEMHMSSLFLPGWYWGVPSSSTDNEPQLTLTQGAGHKFRLVSPGLTGTPGTVSFVDMDGMSGMGDFQYISHHDNKLWVKWNKMDHDQWKQSATFWLRWNLFGEGTLSLECFDKDKWFIYPEGHELQLQQNSGTAAWQQRAGWGYVKPGFIVQPPAPQVPFWTVGGGTGEITSKNYPNRAWGVNGGSKANIVNKDDGHIIQIISPGLTGEPGSISFQSMQMSKPNERRFLRHQSWVMSWHSESNANLFKKDATFFPRQNYFADGFVSFESSNFPKHFIRHQNSRLRISKEESGQLYKDDASFEWFAKPWVVAPKAGGQFQSKNFPDKFWGLSGSAAQIQRDAGQWETVSPGLTGETGSISFKYVGGGCNNCYLRHKNWVMSAHEFSDSDLFKKDATFFAMPDLFYEGWTAFESSNFPNHFIRHQNSRLRISSEQSSTLYKEDASWKWPGL